MDKNFEKKLGLKIKYYRERAGFTQDELAVRMQVNGCDLTRSSIAKIEVGQRHIYPDEIKLMKEILQFSFDDIFVDIEYEV